MVTNKGACSALDYIKELLCSEFASVHLFITKFMNFKTNVAITN